MLSKHIEYVKYVIRHKWFVAVECFKEGLFWRGLTHDLSKLSLLEWFTYANYFYGERTLDFDVDFDLAWCNHIHSNDHHWQHWLLTEDSGRVKALMMRHDAALEMVCDWYGASKAQGKSGWHSTRHWYEENKDIMILHPFTRNLVETTILKKVGLSLDDVADTIRGWRCQERRLFECA